MAAGFTSRRLPRRSYRGIALAAWLTSFVCLIGAASATPSLDDPYRGPGARKLPKNSRSVGWPWSGRLEKGVKAIESNYLRYTGEYKPGDHFWGTWELVQVLERAAYRVSTRFPGSKLSIGELSKKEGGRIAGHGSHQSGRDVDIAFYMLDAGGKPFEPYSFAHFNRKGEGLGINKGLRFDDDRNWELVAKLVSDGDARVQYIFVHRDIRERILAHARKRGAPELLVDRAAKAMVQPARGHPHRNHFHVRIYCAPVDRPACMDRAPFHAWYPGNPPTFTAGHAGSQL